MRSQKLALWIVAGALTVFSFGASAPASRAVGCRLGRQLPAFSVPAVIAGLAVTRWGLRDSASGYALAVVVLALAAALLTMRQTSASPSPTRSSAHA